MKKVIYIVVGLLFLGTPVLANPMNSFLNKARYGSLTAVDVVPSEVNALFTNLEISHEDKITFLNELGKRGFFVSLHLNKNDQDLYSSSIFIQGGSGNVNLAGKISCAFVDLGYVTRSSVTIEGLRRAINDIYRSYIFQSNLSLKDLIGRYVTATSYSTRRP